ncbi:type I protein arginine methyltransferase [Entomortierella parvispora]|uniref:type I protein arginine methyltransferase n=1 Tax=Entomortierella parvispora TaxID=205924 RepID=A0A9P3LZT4_9FUNG|nr:type I protein arginine methyltransferase [Entomortierella parvispora]
MSGRILQGSTAGGSSSNADSAAFNARRQSTISQAYTQSEYSESELGEQDNTWDDWEDEEGMSGADPKCLFCSSIFEDARQVFDHCTKVHGFDFLKTRHTLKLDFYQSIRLINYLRRQAEQAPLEAEKTTSWSVAAGAEFLQDDEYLRPVIEDDSLLFAFEDLDFEDSGEQDRILEEGDVLMPQGDALKRPESQWSKIETKTELEAQLLKELRLAEEKLFAAEVQLSQTEAQFEEYRTRVKASFFDNLVASAPEQSSLAKDEAEEEEPGTVVVPQDEGNYYFNSYAHSDIHQQMLNDRVRTEGYRDFIYENKDVFKGKTVLDVGCGTGILSMFAARAGAAKVLSVDNSDIIEKARKNIVENGFQDIITLYRGKIEEIKLPCKVDVIISEWMGYFLLYEAMLDSVLVARDRFLAPGGILAPSQTRILMTASSDESFLEDSIHYWNDVYGFKMSTMKDNVLQEAVVDFVSPETLVTDTVCLKDLPHQTITVAGLDFITDFELTMQRDDHISAFVGYFDTWFTRDGKDVPLDVGIEKKELQSLGLNGFTTGPVHTRSEETHWKQTMFVLEKALVLQKGDKVKGTFYCHKNHMNPRALDLRIVYEVIKKDGSDVSAQDGMKADLQFYLR